MIIVFEFISEEGLKSKYSINNMDVITGIYFDFVSRMKKEDYNKVFKAIELTSNIDADITLTIKQTEGGFRHTGLI